MKRQYQKLIHRVLEGGKIMSAREIHHAIIDLPSIEDGKPKRRAIIPNFAVLVGMLANNKYGCIRVNDKQEYPALWKLKEE